MLLSAYQEAPKITFTKEWSRFQAYVKIGIQCETVNGVFKEVLEIDTSADMEFNLKLSEDMILRMEIQTFQIKQEQISNSNIGLIKDRNIS